MDWLKREKLERTRLRVKNHITQNSKIWLTVSVVDKGLVTFKTTQAFEKGDSCRYYSSRADCFVEVSR